MQQGSPKILHIVAFNHCQFLVLRIHPSAQRVSAGAPIPQALAKAGVWRCGVWRTYPEKTWFGLKTQTRLTSPENGSIDPWAARTPRGVQESEQLRSRSSHARSNVAAAFSSLSARDFSQFFRRHQKRNALARFSHERDL